MQEKTWSCYYCCCQLPSEKCYNCCNPCLKCIYCFDYFGGSGDHNMSSCHKLDGSWCCVYNDVRFGVCDRIIGIICFPCTCAICCVNGFNLFCIRGADKCCIWCQKNDTRWIKPPPFYPPPPYYIETAI